MNYYFEMIFDHPRSSILIVISFAFVMREVYNIIKWLMDMVSKYHIIESKKEDFHKQVFEIACKSQEHTDTLEHLSKVLSGINTDLKGIQDDIVYLKEAHDVTISCMKDQEDKDAIRDRMNLGMARSMLITNYERCVKKGIYTTDEKEVYHELYEAYEQAGGNGIMKDIRDRILELPDH